MIFLFCFSTIFFRRSTSLPLPPPPNLTEEGAIVQDDTEKNENETNIDNSPPKYFFAPLRSKRKSSLCPELRPDVLLVNNVIPSDGNRIATIRKPHNPLKYPSNLNAASIDPEVIFIEEFQFLFTNKGKRRDFFIIFFLNCASG